MNQRLQSPRRIVRTRNRRRIGSRPLDHIQQQTSTPAAGSPSRGTHRYINRARPYRTHLRNKQSHQQAKKVSFHNRAREVARKHSTERQTPPTPIRHQKNNRQGNLKQPKRQNRHGLTPPRPNRGIKRGHPHRQHTTHQHAPHPKTN